MIFEYYRNVKITKHETENGTVYRAELRGHKIERSHPYKVHSSINHILCHG